MPRIEAIPALRDNYIWAIYDAHYAAFVDPGEAEPIVTWLARRRMRPAALLVTHHHADHCAAAAELRRRYAIPAYGPAQAGEAIDHVVQDGDRCTLPGLNIDFQVLATPGHTLSHLAYFGAGYLFCGDTLFSCGCGRLFEGTAAMLHASLMRLSALPDDTWICCAHEYTLANIEFARSIDPHNLALLAWGEAARRLRAEGQPTLPVRLGEERQRNPFLRCNNLAVRAAILQAGEAYPSIDAVETFARLRARKDRL